MEIEDVEAIPTEIELKRKDQKHGIAPYLSGTSGHKTKTYKTIYKVKTRDGTIGWGETSNIMSADITKAIVEEYFNPRLVGTSVFNINGQKELFPEMLHNIRLDVFYSGIEMAVLDVIGKLQDRPVYDLLGGRGCHRTLVTL